MIAVKIECECGQRYAFDIEPVNGRLPSPIACPSCGADGTTAANAIIGQSLRAEAAPPAATQTPVSGALNGPLRVSLSCNRPAAQTGTVPAGDRPSRSGLLPGQTTRTQAQIEARAKMLWGDSPLQVMAYLLSQGFSREEASELVQEFLAERIRTIRMKGIKYVIMGLGLLLVPGLGGLAYFFGGWLPRSRAIGVIAVVGLFGAWLSFKGIGLLISPKSQSGDASEEIDPDSLFG